MSEMKKYLLFSGESYYARGGWYDFAGTYDTIGAAKAAGKKKMMDDNMDWFHVVNSETGKIVCEIKGCYCGRNVQR